MQKVDDDQAPADLMIEHADALIQSANMMLPLIPLNGYCILCEHWFFLRSLREISERWNVCYRSISREHEEALQELSEYLAKQNKPAEASGSAAEGH